MAEVEVNNVNPPPAGGGDGGGSSLMVGLLALLVVAALVWFILFRGGGGGGTTEHKVDVDVNVPTAPSGGPAASRRNRTVAWMGRERGRERGTASESPSGFATGQAGGGNPRQRDTKSAFADTPRCGPSVPHDQGRAYPRDGASGHPPFSHRIRGHLAVSRAHSSPHPLAPGRAGAVSRVHLSVAVTPGVTSPRPIPMLRTVQGAAPARARCLRRGSRDIADAAGGWRCSGAARVRGPDQAATWADPGARNPCRRGAGFALGKGATRGLAGCTRPGALPCDAGPGAVGFEDAGWEERGALAVRTKGCATRILRASHVAAAVNTTHPPPGFRRWCRSRWATRGRHVGKRRTAPPPRNGGAFERRGCST